MVVEAAAFLAVADAARVLVEAVKVRETTIVLVEHLRVTRAWRLF